MPLPELVANSPTPGSKVPFTTLGAAVVTAPAALTQETWTFAGAPPSDLAQPGQFRFQVDSEILLDITGAGGTARTVLRGVEGSTPATHLNAAQVFHYMTKGALQALMTQAQPPMGTFQVHGAATQVGAAGTWGKAPLGTKDFDTSNWFSTANSRFQPTVAGYYHIDAGFNNISAPLPSGAYVGAVIFKNGSVLPFCGASISEGSANQYPAVTVSTLVYLNGTSDYIELDGISWQSGTTTQLTTVTFTGWMTGFMAVAPPANQSAPGIFSVFGAAAQIGAAAVETKVVLANKDYDLSGWFSTANSRFQPTQPGYYQIDAGAVAQIALADGDIIVLDLRKNGSGLPNNLGFSESETGNAANGDSVVVSALVYLNGTTDYLELWGHCYTNLGAQVTANFICTLQGFQAVASITTVASGIFGMHNTAYAALTTGIAKVPLGTIDYDLSGWCSAGRFTPTQPGYYQISAGIETGTALADGDFLWLELYKNGAALPNQVGFGSAESGNSTFGLSVQTSALVFLNGTGDYLELWASAETSASGSVSATFTGWMTGYQAVTTGVRQGIATAARAYRNGLLSGVVSAGWTKIVVDHLSPGGDPGGNMVLASGHYVCPVTGPYLAAGQVTVQTPTGSSNKIGCGIWRNETVPNTNSVHGELSYTYDDTSDQTVSSVASGVVFCTAGDTLSLYVYDLNGGSAVLYGNEDTNYLSVVQVG